jgi:ATP-dependent DNA helicase RecQ
LAPTVREDLKVAVFECHDAATRLAWVARIARRSSGQGLVFVQTRPDAVRVAQWLQHQNIPAEALTSAVGSGRRQHIEDGLQSGLWKALVTTPAYGMALDKSTLGFVVHYQRPTTVWHWLRQVGDVGLGAKAAHAVILTGRGDDRIARSLIERSFPSDSESRRAWEAIRSIRPTFEDLVATIGANERALARWVGAMLEAGTIGWAGRRLRAIAPDTTGGLEVVSHLRAAWHQDAMAFRVALEERECRLRAIGRLVGEADHGACGHCDVCKGTQVQEPRRDLVLRADAFLYPQGRSIPVRKTWPQPTGLPRAIPEHIRLQEGAALSGYGDGTWGRLVQAGKYEFNRYPDELIEPSVELIRSRGWSPQWITWIPNHGARDLVGDFAERLGSTLGVPVVPTVRLAAKTVQKSRATTLQQYRNAVGTVVVNRALVRSGVCLLVDDIVHSAWTLTVAGIALREAGSGPVIPFALAAY